MKNRYVVLKTPAEITRAEFREAIFRGDVAAVNAGISAVDTELKSTVEVHDLEQQAAGDLARDRGVACVAPVMPMKLIEPMSVGAGPAAPDNVTWGVRAVSADRSPFTGEGIVVAVLDTGIDPNHPAFAGVKLVQENFTTEGPDDNHGHGTHCAGTIFGRDVNGTRIGVARGVKKALIGKVLGAGGGGSDRIAQAVQWAVDGGAHVISMSLGIDFPGYVKAMEARGAPTELATSLALEGYRANVLLFERLASLIAARALFGQTTLLVAAAGNESRHTPAQNFDIAVSPPAVADGFVSVAALEYNAQKLRMAPFSNVGARVAGPGVEVFSAKRGGGLVAMSGTSMATPHVAGVAALWAQKLAAAGHLAGRELENRLVGTASTQTLQAGLTTRQIGAGLVQAPLN